MRRRLAFAEIPEHFRGLTLKQFKASVYRRPESREAVLAASRMVKVYLDHFGEMQGRGMGLYLYSETKGSGKTMMIAGIANELLRGHSVKFSTSLRILNEIKAAWDGGVGTESRLLDAMATCEILVVDDFGTERPSGWVNEKFYHIINERYVARRVTLFTSNSSLDSLDYDDRVTSRIRECTYQIAFPEESVRDYIAEGNDKELQARAMQG